VIEGRTQRYHAQLATFCSRGWRSEFGEIAQKKMSTEILEMVIDAIEALYQSDASQFDIPAADLRLESFTNLAGLPFEVQTWDSLQAAGVTTDVEVYGLLTGSFCEIRQRLGNMRSALDFVVTAVEWIDINDNGTSQCVGVSHPESLEDAGIMARVRAFRCWGLSPKPASYTAHTANVIGHRFAIGVEKRWTLEQCGDALSMTRERARQLTKMRLWSHGKRRWGRVEVLDELHRALLDAEHDEVLVLSTGESISRGDGVALLDCFGYSVEDFEEPWSVSDELQLHGIKLAALQRLAYQESERLGFLTLAELRYHLLAQHPELDGDLFDDIVADVVAMGDLPHGYVYVESSRLSYFKLWMIKLFSVLGPQTLEEAYLAAQRFCRVRIPRLVFPPRSVIEAFFERSEEFWVSEGYVGLTEPAQGELVGVEQWVNRTIMACTGHVIHRTELWDKARQVGVKPGTLNVYTSYSLLVKPVGRGCVTVTGLVPTDTSIFLASNRARAIKVKTVRNSVRIEDGCVLVEVEVGNDLLDSGLLPATKEMRDMMKGHVFQVMTDTGPAGNIRWSDNTMIGFASALHRLQIQPGDTCLFKFSIVDSQLTIEPVADEAN
jgi:hypothetical protein